MANQETPNPSSELPQKEDKRKKLEETIKSLEKQFGKGIVIDMGKNEIVPVEVIPSGSLNLDLALGIGGFPRGRVVEIYGPESSGKTTIALQAVAQAQKRGGLCAFVDAEHALDINYAKALGVDVNNLFVSQPSDGEQALEVVDELIESATMDVIVIDSVAALVPRSEIEGNMGDPQMALQARLMSQALRKITGSMSKSNTCVIFINQLRMKIGVMFGNPETTTGGNALKFYASMRLDVRRIETLKKADQVIGNRVRIKVVKNKLAPPFKEAEFDIFYGEGISRENELLDLAVKFEVVKKSGSWYSYKEERLAQGSDNLRAHLKESPQLMKEIEKQVLDKLKEKK